MEFKIYQIAAKATAIYPKDMKIIYPTLGLCGESGEVAEKVKKWIRDDYQEMTPERLNLLKKELGDVLWYLSNLASDLGLELEDIAEHNLTKLAERKNEGKLQGSGDTR